LGWLLINRKKAQAEISPPPYVDGITPDSGPTAGGTTVAITGRNFLDGATVTIDNVDATDVIFVDSILITATTPAGMAGAKDVIVYHPDGVTFGCRAGAFTYQ
jgi:hypothetical protein